MEYINFGKVVNVSASVPTAIDDTTYHIIIDFVPDDPDIFDDFHDNMDEILKRPDNYVLCNIEDIVKRIKEKQAFEDRIKELEGQLADAKKESDKKLCEAYMETNAVLYNSAYKFISFDKEFAEIKKDRDYWKARFGSVVEDFSKTLAANGVEFTVKAIDGNKWNAIVDIPELNEAKKKVEDLEKKLAAAKSKETFWRGRKEEYEGYHHYWLNTFDRAVKLAAEKGIHIGVRGNDDECNAGIVTLDNMKAEELEKQVVALEKTNKNLSQKISAADNALEYWNNTYNDIVIAGKKVGVNIDIKGKRSDSNAGFVHVTNQKALELLWQNNYDKKWQAMLDALKDKGVEVIYMGEEDGKPIVDVKIPEIDILKKELEALKSRTLDNVEIRLSCGDIVWTYCDGFVHVSSGMISADEISTGTVPKCKSCAHYMHNPSRWAHDWCYKPVSKEGGAGYIRKLSKEEAEGPACYNFKARKE